METINDLERVARCFVGEWRLVISNQWWIKDPDAVLSGTAQGAWLDDAFVRLRVQLDANPGWDFVFGRSDANDRFVALYHDGRGVRRVFDLTIDGESWTMERKDPDFHQRFSARIEGVRMVGQADASDDGGATWRKDFDLVWERVS